MYDLANRLRELQDQVADLRVERARLRDALAAIVEANDAMGGSPAESGVFAAIDAARVLLVKPAAGKPSPR